MNSANYQFHCYQTVNFTQKTDNIVHSGQINSNNNIKIINKTEYYDHPIQFHIPIK